MLLLDRQLERSAESPTPAASLSASRRVWTEFRTSLDRSLITSKETILELAGLQEIAGLDRPAMIRYEVNRPRDDA